MAQPAALAIRFASQGQSCKKTWVRQTIFPAARRVLGFPIMGWGEEHKLFVGGLSWDTNDDGLWNAFNKFGNITFQRVCMDRETGQSRGFGFVSFDDKDNAEKAIKEMDGAELDGRSIKVNMAMPRVEGAKGGKGGGEWSPRPKGICFAFQKGECTRGDQCRFAHEKDENAAAAELIARRVAEDAIATFMARGRREYSWFEWQSSDSQVAIK